MKIENKTRDLDMFIQVTETPVVIGTFEMTNPRCQTTTNIFKSIHLKLEKLHF